MNFKFKKIAAALLIGTGMVLGNTSCSDDLDLAPIDYFGLKGFWKDQSMFEGNVYALAQMFRGNYPSNILFYAGELRAGTMSGTLINGSGLLSDARFFDNNYDLDHPQFSTFGGYYGFIADINEFIYQAENQPDALEENVKNGLLGMMYGWRAYAYFQMYRMYGGVVLRLEPQVVLGDYSP